MTLTRRDLLQGVSAMAASALPSGSVLDQLPPVTETEYGPATTVCDASSTDTDTVPLSAECEASAACVPAEPVSVGVPSLPGSVG